MREKDIAVVSSTITFFDFENRMPLKFGHEITTKSSLCRATITVRGADGRTAVGVGETPMAVSWTWPGTLSYSERLDRMMRFCDTLNDAWNSFTSSGHPMEIGHRFLEERLHDLLASGNRKYDASHQMPYLSALVCNSLFDLALYDAYGKLHKVKAFDIFTPEYMNHDLSHYYGEEYRKAYVGKYPCDYMLPREKVPQSIPAWHLVGGTDPLESEDLTGNEPDDGYPVLLRDWIRADGLYCLKIKLVGNDAAWDYDRIVHVGNIAGEMDVPYLSADFNCTVQQPAYVLDLMKKLQQEHPDIFKKLLYIEQPFPYDIEHHPIDVHEISKIKPLFLDESAHDWRYVAIGHRLGWSGVALKTCKTLTGAMLSLCWAREHGMDIMVQDLTNPKLAIIPHALLAANVGTIMGVEVNSMQFCPEASREEAKVHPGLYKRNEGEISLTSLGNTGFGYRLDEIEGKSHHD